MKDPHLISVDELRAAGALDVPASWRKTLGEERDLFSGLLDEATDSQEDARDSEDDSEEGSEDEAT